MESESLSPFFEGSFQRFRSLRGCCSFTVCSCSNFEKKILQDRYKIQMLGYLKDSPGLAVSLGLKFNPKPGPMTCTRNLYCLLPEKIQSSSASAARSGKGAPASGGSHSKGNIAPLEIRHGGGGEPRWSRKPARRLLLRVQYPNHPYL